MTCRLLSLSSEAMWPELLRLLENRDNPDQTVETDVRAMLDAVRKGGDSAVLEYVRRFDCPDMRPPLRVPAEDLEQAARAIPAESLDCIKQAADNIRVFHEAQKDRSWFLTRDDGTILGQKIEAVDRAGLYVPGGRGGNTPLISSLLMTAIPAQAAGVREIAVVTPPRADGTLISSPPRTCSACMKSTAWAGRGPSPRSPTAPKPSRPWTSSPGRATSG